MLLTLNLIRIEIGKICRGTVRSTDTSATGTEPRQAESLSLKTCRGTVRVAVQSVNRFVQSLNKRQSLNINT